MSKSLSIDRDTLYNEVWRIPMITLGQEKYGVSRSTIKWACMQMGVPLPPQAYWTHLARGRKIVDQPTLPPRRQNQPQTIGRAELMKREPKNHETFEQLLKGREKALRIMEEEIRYAEFMEEVDGWHRAEPIRSGVTSANWTGVSLLAGRRMKAMPSGERGPSAAPLNLIAPIRVSSSMKSDRKNEP